MNKITSQKRYMKKFLILLLSICLSITPLFLMTGCSFIDDMIDATELEVENKLLKEENENLKKEQESLITEITTLKFLNKFPNGIITEDATLTNVSIVVDKKDGIALTITNGVTVTIEDGYFNGGEGGNNQAVRIEEGGTLIIKDGTFTVGKDADGNGNSVIENRGGTLIIEGGLFSTDYAWNGFYYVLNQLNSKPGTITVKGGTFVNYNPAEGDDFLKGNFVADGYRVEAEIINDTTTLYHVLKDIESKDDSTKEESTTPEIPTEPTKPEESSKEETQE